MAFTDFDTLLASRLSRAPHDFLERIAIEGDPLATFGFGVNVSVPTGPQNASIVTSNFPPLVGKCAILTSIVAGASAAGLAQVGIGPDINGRFPGIYHQFVLPTGGGSVSIPITPLLVRAHEFQNGAVALAIRNNLNAGSVTYSGTVSASGAALTDDFNFTAAYTIGSFGDSTQNGTGPSLTAKMFPFIVRDWLIAQGYDCRVVLKSRSGSTSSDHELWRKAGWHSSVCNPYAMGFYNLGINDAITSVDPSTVVANLTAFWTWWTRKYPNAPLVVVGVTPLTLNASETNAVAIRSAVSAYVASVGSPLFKYVDTSTLWDRTNTALYNGGDGIHYLDAGHALVAGAITSMLAANPAVRPSL